MPLDKINILHNLNTWIWLPFSTYCSLKKSIQKYPDMYLDRILKIWIMKKFDIQSIQVSMYPKKTDIHLSMYPSMHPKKSVSKISMYPDIWKKWYPLIPNWHPWQKKSKSWGPFWGYYLARQHCQSRSFTVKNGPKWNPSCFEIFSLFFWNSN